MLVDGDANFRHVFASVAAEYGAVVTAESGAEALAMFRRNPVDLVFIGEQLGIMGADVLIRKIREAEDQGTVFVKVGSAAAGTSAEAYAATIPRPFVPQALAAALRPFVHIPGPLSALTGLAPHFDQCLGSAVVQVFGMMSGLDAAEDVVVPALVDAGVLSLVTVTAGGQYLIDLELVLPTPVARDLSTRLLGCADAEVDQDAVFSTASELANMVSGRLDAWLKGQQLSSVCTLPATRDVAAGEVLPPFDAGAGTVRAFTLEGHTAPVLLRTCVRRPH